MAHGEHSRRNLHRIMGALAGVLVLALVAWASPIVAFVLAALAWTGHVIHDETRRAARAPQLGEIALTIRVLVNGSSRTARANAHDRAAVPLVHGSATASRRPRSELSLLGA